MYHYVLTVVVGETVQTTFSDNTLFLTDGKMKARERIHIVNENVLISAVLSTLRDGSVCGITIRKVPGTRAPTLHERVVLSDIGSCQHIYTDQAPYICQRCGLVRAVVR